SGHQDAKRQYPRGRRHSHRLASGSGCASSIEHATIGVQQHRHRTGAGRHGGSPLGSLPGECAWARDRARSCTEEQGPVSQFSTYVITEPCEGVKNGACLEICPVDCIHTAPGEDQYYIDPSVCIACEQCALVCPVEAIFLDVDVPAQWRSYIEKNANFYRRTKGEPMPVPVDKALKMIQAGHAKALELDIDVSVTVVDEGGRLIAFV